MPMVKKRIGSGVASTSHSPTKPEEGTPVGSRSGKPSQLLNDPTEVEVPAVVDLIMEVLVITPDWTVPYIAYILRKELPENEEEA